MNNKRARQLLARTTISKVSIFANGAAQYTSIWFNDKSKTKNYATEKFTLNKGDKLKVNLVKNSTANIVIDYDMLAAYKEGIDSND